MRLGSRIGQVCSSLARSRRGFGPLWATTRCRPVDWCLKPKMSRLLVRTVEESTRFGMAIKMFPGPLSREKRQKLSALRSIE